MTAANASPLVLVVDDDADLRLLLETYLGMRGLAVVAVGDRASALAALRERPIDLVVLDLGIGAEDGLQLLAELRGAGDVRPVVVLSGRDGLDDRLAGLGRGADDYVTKPFEPRELLARIRAVLRRAPAAPPAPPSPKAVRLGRTRFEPERGRLVDAASGVEVPLTAMELELLRSLLRHGRRALSREQLHEHAFGAPPAHGSRGIDNLVLRLRRRIEADPARPAVLVTVRGEGYALNPDVVCERTEPAHPR